LSPVRLEDLLDPLTGRIRTRLVDVSAEAYTVARDYMVRLERTDLTEPFLSTLAAQTNLSAAAFRDRFAKAAAG
jgi:ATP-dependent phosphofructokinase / diphosphate-dependent phosphofructokinase